MLWQKSTTEVPQLRITDCAPGVAFYALVQQIVDFLLNSTI